MNFLVTGAARGIGRGLSRMLLRTGHRVLLVDNNVAELNNTAALLTKHGHASGKDFATVECNLRNPGEITAAAKQAAELFDGHLDCLINNAACPSKSLNFSSPQSHGADLHSQTPLASAARISPPSPWKPGPLPSKPTSLAPCS